MVILQLQEGQCWLKHVLCLHFATTWGKLIFLTIYISATKLCMTSTKSVWMLPKSGSYFGCPCQCCTICKGFQMAFEVIFSSRCRWAPLQEDKKYLQLNFFFFTATWHKKTPAWDNMFIKSMLQKYNNWVSGEPKPCWFSPVDIYSKTDLNLCCQVGAVN